MKTATRKSARSMECYKSITMNTALVPCLDVSMYESILSPSCIEEDVLYHNVTGSLYPEFLYVDSFDNERYKGIVFSCASKILLNEIQPILERYGVSSLSPVCISSPEYYNYETDSLVFEVNLKPDFMDTFHLYMVEFRKNASLKIYIEDNYWSRSGFISFMPQSFDEIESFQDEERCLAAYLTFCLLVEGIIRENENPYSDYLYEEVIGNGAYDCVGLKCYISKEILFLYKYNSNYLNDLMWSLFYKIGHQWKNYDSKELNSTGAIKNDMLNFVFWATDKGYTLNDLKRMADDE